MPISFNVGRAMKKVADHARRAQSQTGVPGIAIAIVSDKTTAFEQTGTTTAGGSTLITPDTVFQLASLSKPIATTIAAWQLSRNKWGWDAAVARELPDFALANPAVSVGALFAHRSGLPEHAGDLLEDMGYDRKETLRRLGVLPLSPGHVAPGGRFVSSYAYTNFGFTAAALAVARSGGCDWPVLAERVLYQPLGMSSTSSRFAAFDAALSAGTGAFPHQRTPAPLAGTPALPAGATWRLPAQVRNADSQSPAGGVCSTARDLAQWLRLQLGLVDDGHFDAAFRAQLALTQQPYTPSAAYGFGWNVDLGSDGSDGQPPRPLRLSHSGAFLLGAATAVMILPQCQTGIVVLTNGQPVGVPEALCRAFMKDALEDRVDFDAILLEAADMMRDSLYKVPEPPPRRPSPPRGARIADDYKATYTHPFYGPFTVGGSGQAGTPPTAFHIAMGPSARPRLHPLAPYNGDTFLYEPPGENGGGQSAVAFASVQSGPITGVEIEHLYEPYTVGHEFPPPREFSRYVSDTWKDVYFIDTGLVIGFDAVLRSWTFVALTAERVALVVYRPDGDRYAVRAQTAYETPRQGEVNTFFTGPLEVRAGDRIGFHQPELGAIAFKLDPGAPWDRGEGQFGGRVWFTPGAKAAPSEFSSSTDRTYLLQVEVAWGVRGPGIARR